MKIRTMIRIDEWAGIPLGRLLALLRSFRPLFRPIATAPPSSPRRILVTKYFGMGSLVLALPMLRALRRRFPDAEIHALTFEGNREVLARLSEVDCVHTIRTGTLPGFLADTTRVVLALRALRIDLGLDLEFFSRFSAILPSLAGVRYRVGFGPALRWRRALLDRAVPFERHRHIEEGFLELARAVGAGRTPRVEEPALRVRRADLLALERALRAAGVAPEARLLVVNVNASLLCLERRWPLESFASLLERIEPRLDGIRVVCIGTAEERSHVEGLLDLLEPRSRRRASNLAGDLGVGGLLALLSRAEGLLTNDSGPMHLASAMGTRVVALFGPESPELYGPRGEGHAVFYRPVPCSPCLNVYRGKISPCGGNNVCMRSIEVAEVARAVLSMLRRDATARPEGWAR